MRYCWIIALLALLLATHLAFAAGPNPPAPLSQSATPTPASQIFMPVVSGGAGETQTTSQSAAPASSALNQWWIGIAALLAVSFAYLVLRARRK